MKLKLALALALAAMLAGCADTRPVYSPNNQFPASGKYKILGRVTIKVDKDDSGFLELLKAAMDEYPECDDVVNIMVDYRKGTFGDDFIMTGIAVDYPEM